MQKASPGGNDDKQMQSSKPASKAVLVSIADTTWRMFVPSLGCTFLGIWLDEKWGTSPWLLFAGIILGFVIAGLAVRLQYKRLIKL